ncbi:MAG: hypothetical protein AB7H88_08415 [Vicinamibacterales bacterium]
MATWRIEFPDDGAYVLIVVSATASLRDFVDALHEYQQRPEFRAGMDALWDLTDAALDISADQVREAVAVYGELLEERGTGHRVAYVVAREVDYGVLRMYEAYAGGLPYTTGVFKTLADARAFLGARPA